MTGTITRVKLVFADRGSFHDMFVNVPTDVLGRYERLIDALREDPEITHTLHVDPRRLVAASVVTGEE